MKTIQEIKPKNSNTTEKVQRVKSEKSGGMVFAPGVSGNPAGRPKGTRNFSSLWDDSIEDIAKLNNITPSEAEKVLIKKAWSEAKNGKFPFYKDILDRLYGTALNRTDLTTDGKEFPIPIYGGNSKK